MLSICVKGKPFKSFQKNSKHGGVRVGTKLHLKGLPVLGEMPQRFQESLLVGVALAISPIRLEP